MVKKSISFLLVGLIAFLYSIHVSASTTDILISVQSSTVGNLYYEVIHHQQRISEDINYVIYNQSDQIYVKGNTNQGLIQQHNLPYGQYTIVINHQLFPITIDHHYLQTQHILKQLDISPPLVSSATKDSIFIQPILFLFLASGLGILLINKRKGTYEQSNKI